jgi:quinol monooxygenase YgiN
MATQDTCCTIVPYFKVHTGKIAAFRDLCERFVARTSTEQKCLYYGFSFDGDEVHRREGYVDADGAIHHLENVGALLREALTIADLVRLEIHGPAAELEKLRPGLDPLKPRYFTLDYGFRKTQAGL